LDDNRPTRCRAHLGFSCRSVRRSVLCPRLRGKETAKPSKRGRVMGCRLAAKEPPTAR
jgi:hypothetical protein